MIVFTSLFRQNYKYSQNGEEGILLEALKRIPVTNKVAVEFGGADGFFCSNTRLLAEQHGWRVHMYDLHPQSDLVEQREITPENVNDLPKCSLLSIDCDGPDYGIWKAYKGKPDIVIIEINSSKSPFAYAPINSPTEGTAYLPMLSLGLSKGYFLLSHTGNAIFILNKHRRLFPEIIGDGIGNCELYFDTSYLSK